MATPATRAVFTSVLREVAYGVIRTLAVEAARSTAQRADPALVPRYEQWLRAFVPAALRVAEAPDAERPRLLDEMLRVEPPAIDAVPPVARFGLLSLGMRLTRAAVREHAGARNLEVNAIDREMAAFENAFAAHARAREGAAAEPPRAASS